MYRYLYPSSWKRKISSWYSPSSSEQSRTSPSTAEDGGQNVDLLPPDIIYSEIVPRLPVKSLCRSKCVSKSWRSLISHILIKRRRLLVAVLGKNGSPNRLCYQLFNHIENGHDVDGLEVAPTDLDFVSGVHGWLPWVYYSCYGSFLTVAFASNGDTNVSLNNPVTKESKILPKLSAWRRGRGRGDAPVLWKNMYGVGFDYSTYEYKVINLQDYGDGIMFGVYTMQTDCWRQIAYVYPYYTNQTEGIVVNGAVHWLATKKSDLSLVIMSFLLAEEEVREIAVPPGVTGPEVELSGAFRNWLCITSCLEEDRTSNEFWDMKEYGVWSSWTKMQVSIPYHELQHSGFWTESHDLMVFDRRSLVLYNFNDDTFWNVSVGGDIVKDGFFRSIGFYALEDPAAVLP